MANSFGGTIKLTGEGEYKKALKDITSDIRLMSSEMKVMATTTDASGKATDADKARKVALTKAIEEQKAKLVELNKILQDSNAKNGENSESSKRLQIQVNNATSQLNKMQNQLVLTDDAGRKLGVGFDDTGKKASIFGDVLKANLASDVILGSVKAIGSGIKQLGGFLVDMVGDSVKSFAEYEQLIGGVETLFKDSSNVVSKNAQEAYKTAGISANQYMQQATSFSATLLQGLGGDTAKASEFANTAILDMSDNANKMGTDIGLIQSAYQGFAKDNYTMLDNLKLGYGGTAGEMARLVNDSGVMGTSFKATAENVKDIPFDQLITALHKTQKEMGITGTTAKEASETISGSLQSTKASWENVLTSFATGNDDQIKASMDGLIESASNLANNVVEILPNIVDGIGQLAQGLIEQIPTIVTTILPTLMSALQGLINSVMSVLPTLIPVVVQLITTVAGAIVQNLPLIVQAGIDILLGLVTGITQSLPTLIPAIVEAIKTITKTLLDNLPALIKGGIELLVALIQGLYDAMPELIKMIPMIITTIIQVLTKPEMIKLLIKASLDLIIAIAGGLIKAIPEIVKAVPQILSALVTGLLSGLGTLADVGLNLVKGIWDGISNATSWILGKIKGFGTSILDGIKGFFGIKSPSRLFRDEIGTNLALGLGIGFSDSMKDVSKDMKNAIPTSFDTDINLNNASLASNIANTNSLSSQLNSESLVGSIQQAFKSVKIELDDKPLGNFVVSTVEGAIYG